MIENASYRMSRFWCHSCHKPFLLDLTAQDFTCANCRSEWVEELNNEDTDDPRRFRLEHLEPSPVYYTVIHTRYIFPPAAVLGQSLMGDELEHRIQAILGFINTHTGGHSGVQPATTAQIQSLPSVDASELGKKECPICQEECASGGDIKKMPCGHTFHEGCLTRWLEMHNSCPVCRARLAEVRANHSSSCDM